MRSSKKSAASKRTRPPRRVDFTRDFHKDWERLSRSGRYDMNRLKSVMLHLIANEAPLGPDRRDHALRGAWANHRECHIGGDFLLIYQVDDSPKPGGSINFVRAGTHAELFK